MTDRDSPAPEQVEAERFPDRLKREAAAAFAFFRAAPERMRGVRANAGDHARHHARRGAVWLASWFSLGEGVADLAIVLLVVVAAANAYAPRSDLPWKPLSLNDPVGPLTKAKLGVATGGFRAGSAPASGVTSDQCRAFLSREAVAFTVSPIASDNPDCAVPEAIALGPDAGLAPASPPMDCGLASAFLVWRRQVVEPAARLEFGADVKSVNTVGVHQCRTIARTSRPSDHMQAKAMDVGSITLSDGTVVSVTKDWADPGPKGRFLHAIRDGACKTFSGGALSPDYNADHHDHLHLDVGGYSICG